MIKTFAVRNFEVSMTEIQAGYSLIFVLSIAVLLVAQYPQP